MASTFFHFLATAMIGGGIVGAGHGFSTAWRSYQQQCYESGPPPYHRDIKELWRVTWPTAVYHGVTGMLLTPVAPVLLVHKFMSSSASPCPDIQRAKNAAKSLMK